MVLKIGIFQLRRFGMLCHMCFLCIFISQIIREERLCKTIHCFTVSIISTLLIQLYQQIIGKGMYQLGA